MIPRPNYFIFGISLACLALSSCVDDNYDLSDIDTTVRVDVNNLTIPVNLDEIELKSILDESEQIKIIDNQYMVTEDGTFESASIRIGRVDVTSSPINSFVVDIPFAPAAVSALGEAGYFDISTPARQFSFNAADIPDEITAVDAIGGDLMFEFGFYIEGIDAIAKQVEFRDLVLQLPKGLTLVGNEGGTYDPSTGMLSIASRTLIGERMSLRFSASHADLKVLGADFSYADHSLSVTGDIHVAGGKILISADDLKTIAAPTNLKLAISYSVPGFPITSFSGGIKYDITGVDISDVDLSDLPDVLTQDGTDISIANPCIYLRLNNPMQPYRLTARTGMTITSHHGEQLADYSINNPYFTIGNNHDDGIYAFCLSPTDPANRPEDFAAAEYVPFASLSNVLSGHGLPSSLSISLDNPCLPDQKVDGLPLGVELGSIHGNYLFRAPIALKEGSTIVYADEATGWGSEDFDHVTITELNIRATIQCDIPIALDIKANPIDAGGNIINNVSIEGVHIADGSQPQEVNIRITGNITGLDGIRYEAVATAGPDGGALRPDMNIRVSNLRPTVSGYYEKEL
jgi:hypothetical protein